MDMSQPRIRPLPDDHPFHSTAPIQYGSSPPRWLPACQSGKYLRQTSVTPRLGDLNRIVNPAGLSAVGQLIARIWQQLLQQLVAPIAVKETPEYRFVTVFDNIRYLVCKRSGSIIVKERWTNGHTTRWKVAEGGIAVALPLKPRGNWLEAWLSRWWSAFAETGLTTSETLSLCSYLVPRINQALLRSSWWRRLRRDAGAALGLDAEVTRYCRLGRTHCGCNDISSAYYNAMLGQRSACREIHADNPRLLWLYMLMRSEGIALPSAGIVAAMRKKLLTRGRLPPVAWRMVANGHPRDFRVALDFLAANDCVKDQLRELCTWLFMMVNLRRTRPVPLAVQQLFLHDSFRYDDDKEQFRFRGANFDRVSFRLLLEEAERRMKCGTLQQFAEGELVDVVTMLSFEPPMMDTNRTKAGWPWLVKQAREWRALNEQYKSLRLSVCWESLLGPVEIAGWRVEPLTDAWAVRRLSIQQRNCAHSYIERCVRGRVRLFLLRNRCGKVVATLGIERQADLWKLFDIRGFANAPVEADMRDAGNEVARRYTQLWLRAHQDGLSSLDDAVSTLRELARPSTRAVALMRKRLGQIVTQCGGRLARIASSWRFP